MWSTGCVIVLVILAVSGWLAYLSRNLSRDYAIVQKRLDRDGTIVLGWIVFANDNLYKRNAAGNCWDGQVVFTTEPLPHPEQELERLAGEIRHFVSHNDDDDDERIIGQIVKVEIGYHHPLRIPKRVAGRLKAYTATVSMETDYFPESRITLPYVYCKVILDEDTNRRHAKHIPYPRRMRTASTPGVSPLVDFANLEFPRAKVRKDYTTRLFLSVIAIGAGLSIGLVFVVLLVLSARRASRPADPQAEPTRQAPPLTVPGRPNPPDPAVPAKPGDFAGRWVRVTDGLTEVWTIKFDNGRYDVSGVFFDGDREVGSFVGKNTIAAGGEIAFEQQFVRLPQRPWLDGAIYTAKLENGKLVYTWNVAGGSGTRDMTRDRPR